VFVRAVLIELLYFFALCRHTPKNSDPVYRTAVIVNYEFAGGKNKSVFLSASVI